LSNISAELNEDAFFKENTIQSIQHQIEGYINY
jgi:hypothetical protein